MITVHQRLLADTLLFDESVCTTHPAGAERFRIDLACSPSRTGVAEGWAPSGPYNRRQRLFLG